MNPFLNIDGYKLDHRRQYPDGTTRVYSNWTPRGCRIPGQNSMVFFGLQYFLQKYMMEEMQEHFFDVPSGKIADEYSKFTDNYLGPDNGVGTDHIVDVHGLGYIPLKFNALPEGTNVPLRMPPLVVENTHDDFFWVTNYFETLMSTILWMPCTSASTSVRIRKMLNKFAVETNGSLDFVPWQGHDFSMRGMSGVEAAMLSGAGHLVAFTGTDTIPAIKLIERYYSTNSPNGLIGGSVAATEHSVMCAGGHNNETDTIARLIKIYPKGILSIVSDTWDLWHVITRILPFLRDKIMMRDGKIVIRPDSGDPVKIICGDPNSTDPYARKGVVQLLWEIFGGTISSNANGSFKHLDPHIGVIYGDGINYERAELICQGLRNNGFSSTNIVFGFGSYTFQYVTRDTYGLAMKATWAKIDGQGKALFKKPVTDGGEKFSATGRLSVTKDKNGKLQVTENATPEQEEKSLLVPVWSNGTFLRRQNIKEIRELALQ